MAADSLVKASTHEKVGPGPLWKTPGLQLPAYIQHIANDLREKRGLPTSQAIATAVAACRRWAAGGGNVDANTRAAARKALAEWEAAKARARATPNKTAHPEGARLALAGPWDPSKHPRAPKGSANGGQFGPARNADAAKAQQNTGARAAYGKTIGAKDAKTRIAGMTNDDLIALAKAAYSFKSQDPKVVALRVLIANEIAHRGGNVNDYGGLGKATPGGPKPLTGGAAKPAPKPTPKPASRRAQPRKRPAAVPAKKGA